MYSVIIVLDETRSKSYYYSYTAEDGNVQCEELPPYQDIDKARACYLNDGAWVFDADKYAEIVAAAEAERATEEQVRREAEAAPTNAELAAGLMELAAEVAALRGGM